MGWTVQKIRKNKKKTRKIRTTKKKAEIKHDHAWNTQRFNQFIISGFSVHVFKVFDAFGFERNGVPIVLGTRNKGSQGQQFHRFSEISVNFQDFAVFSQFFFSHVFCSFRQEQKATTQQTVLNWELKLHMFHNSDDVFRNRVCVCFASKFVLTKCLTVEIIRPIVSRR